VWEAVQGDARHGAPALIKEAQKTRLLENHWL
jgi:hypothetical protein